MSKKLMLLAAGALSALAFAALPAVSSAGEFEAHCSVVPCTAAVTGGIAKLINDNNEKVECQTLTGTATLTNTSSTGSAQLLFHSCRGPLNVKCNNVVGQTETITTNVMTSHLIYIDSTAERPEPNALVGILLTGVNVTFECASGLVKKTVTGNIIGKIENPNCGVARTHHTVEFNQGVTVGTQEYTQVTTIGPVFDLTSGTHASDATTSSQAGTGHLTYNGGGTVTLTC
jgi:hypothetical protein